jgi:medium-chain acyl-CoA synthetase
MLIGIFGPIWLTYSNLGWAKASYSFFSAWNCGAALFVHDDRGAFDPKNIFDNLHQYPITTLCAPPTAYRQMIIRKNQEYFKRNPPLKLEHCTSAGEPLNDEVVRVWKKLAGLEICDGYGQTETILICGNFAGSPIRPGSMGKPLPGVPLMVIDPEGNETAIDAEGEIGILLTGEKSKSDNFFGLFDGYISSGLSAVRKTAHFLQPNGTTKTFYMTGDRATRDADGYIWFVGRADDVINSAGYRIGPFEVESTLKLHPAVVESAAVASPDPARGEVVKAFVVLTDEYKSSDREKLTRELQNFCKEKASPYKYPRKIQFVDAQFLPKTISGKIKRNELKKLEWQGEKSKL